MKKILLFLSLSWMVTSCKKTEVKPQSDMIGYVKLYDIVGSPLDDNSGITVTADLNGAITSANSDKTGKFTLSNLSAGTYNLTYSGTNFPTVKRYGITHVGVGSNFFGNQNIGAKADFRLNSFVVTASSGIFKFSGTYSKAESRNMLVFFGRTINVTKDNAVSPLSISITGGQLPSATNYSSSNLTSRGFSIGETIYAIAYPSTAITNSYIELETGKVIYPALGEPSNLTTFVLQ